LYVVNSTDILDIPTYVFACSYYYFVRSLCNLIFSQKIRYASVRTCLFTLNIFIGHDENCKIQSGQAWVSAINSCLRLNIKTDAQVRDLAPGRQPDARRAVQRAAGGAGGHGAGGGPAARADAHGRPPARGRHGPGGQEPPLRAVPRAHRRRPVAHLRLLRHGRQLPLPAHRQEHVPQVLGCLTVAIHTVILFLLSKFWIIFQYT